MKILIFSARTNTHTVREYVIFLASFIPGSRKNSWKARFLEENRAYFGKINVNIFHLSRIHRKENASKIFTRAVFTFVVSWERFLTHSCMSTIEARRKLHAPNGQFYHEFQVHDSLYGVCINAAKIVMPLTTEQLGLIWLRTIGRKLYPNIKKETRDRKLFFNSLGMEEQVWL